MHPVAIVGIIVGGIVCIWGGYEIGTHVLDWISCRREQRKYEEYIRDYHEKQVLLQHEDSDDDDDDTPLASNYLSSSSMLRQRNSSKPMNDDDMVEQRGNSLMGFVVPDEEKQDTTLIMPTTVNTQTSPTVSRDRTPSDTSSASKSSWAHASDEDEVPSSLDGSSFGILSLSSSSELHHEDRA